MNLGSAAQIYDVPADVALQRLSEFPNHTPVILDLDETLLLENSSERFVDMVRPRLIGRLLLLLLEKLKPWRRLGGDRHRDLVRIRLILMLFPWTMPLWRKHCKVLAESLTNRALLDAAGQRSMLVLTFGYTPIVAPLVEAMVPGARLVSSALTTRDRDGGKLQMLREQAPDFPLAEAIVVTDSMDDADLLSAARHPMRVIWPDARVLPALMGVYLPLLYVERVRRPGTRYFFRGVVQDELIVVLLAALPLALAPLPLAFGLCLLCLSFWCIYEQGYVDNDVLSRNYESEHVRPASDLAIAYGSPYLAALAWSIAFAIPGLILSAEGTGRGLAILSGTWAAVLLATAGYFALYNRLVRRARIVIFGGLHALRGFCLPAIAAISLPGFLMILANIVFRQIEDYARKTVDRNARLPDLFIIKLLLYTFFVLGYAVVFRPSGSTFWIEAGLMFAYGLVRARQDARDLSTELAWVWSNKKKR